MVERSCAFDPAALSAREARRFVRGLLADAGRSSWSEAAELAVSEVVTNVVLHAHTPFELTVRVEADDVLVEVRDFNPSLPHQRSYAADATTGRGLSLVQRVSSAMGIRSLGAAGKVVWFRVGGDVETADPDELLAAWVDAAPSPPAPGQQVRLLGLPVALLRAAGQHDAGLLRELQLYRVGHGDVVSEDELALAEQARQQVATALDTALDAADRAPTSGQVLPSDDRVDLVLTAPPGTAEAFRALRATLDVAERLAAEETLLVRPGTAAVTRLRAWVCDQVLGQLGGAAPQPLER